MDNQQMTKPNPFGSTWSDFSVYGADGEVHLSTVMDTISVTPDGARALAAELQRLADEAERD